MTVGASGSRDQGGKRDVSVRAGVVNLTALIFLPLVSLFMMLLYWRVHGYAAFVKDVEGLFRLYVLIPVVAASVVVHEALHAVGFMWFGQLPRGAVRFGFHWKALAPYAHVDGVMRASAYRKAILLPVLTLGGVPAALGLAFGAGWLYAYGVLMVAAAGGDLMVLWVIRSVAADEWVMDHAERPGCWVLLQEEQRLWEA